MTIAVVATIAIGLALPWEPDRVSVTITNPTDHRLYITTSARDDERLSFVLIVPARSTATQLEVIDRGPQWMLHLRTLGSPAGTVEASRADLLDGSFTIPISLNDELAVAGVPPTVTDPASDR